MMDPRIPAGLSDVMPMRARALDIALSQEGIREATGNNDGPVEKYMPAWAKKKRLPWCAWFAQWPFLQMFDAPPYKVNRGGVWDLYHDALAHDELIMMPEIHALGLWPQPGDILLMLHESPDVRGPGHATIMVRADADYTRVNCIEGNWRNQVGFTTRPFSDFDGAINPWGRLANEHHAGSWTWERGLLPATPAGGLAGTR